MRQVFSVNSHIAEDSERGWATREPGATSLLNIGFWYNPQSGLTMLDVVEIIDKTILNPSGWRTLKVTVRGREIMRDHLSCHMAVDHLRDNEAFNVHVGVACCCCCTIM